MTLSPARRSPLEDGRQSPMAASLQRGVRRLFATLGQATVTELILATGRRADVMALSRDGTLTIVEIKSSLVDFRTDQKWSGYRAFCDQFFFAVGGDFPVEVMPPDVGLIVADAYGAAVIRAAPPHPLAGARRKAVTLRFAQTAAARLHALADPDGAGGLGD